MPSVARLSSKLAAAHRFEAEIRDQAEIHRSDRDTATRRSRGHRFERARYSKYASPPSRGTSSRGSSSRESAEADSRQTVGMASELEELRTALDRLRASVLRKLTGLSDADARRSTVPSGTNIAGLVQHLTFVESLWFEEIVSGGSAGRGKRSMQVDQSVSLATLRSQYRAACTASNAIISSVGDADAPVTRAGKTHDLRWAILSVLEETARHAGHADIIREQIDGRTGR